VSDHHHAAIEIDLLVDAMAAKSLLFLLLTLAPFKLNTCYFKIVLNPFQIIVHLTFLSPSLFARLIQKIILDITSFVVACFINKSSSRMT